MNLYTFKIHINEIILYFQIVHLEDGAHCNKKMYYYDRHYTGHEETERPTRRGTKRYRDKDAPKRALYVVFAY